MSSGRKQRSSRLFALIGGLCIPLTVLSWSSPASGANAPICHSDLLVYLPQTTNYPFVAPRTANPPATPASINAALRQVGWNKPKPTDVAPWRRST
jgi:hypothetical protein